MQEKLFGQDGGIRKEVGRRVGHRIISSMSQACVGSDMALKCFLAQEYARYGYRQTSQEYDDETKIAALSCG